MSDSTLSPADSFQYWLQRDKAVKLSRTPSPQPLNRTSGPAKPIAPTRRSVSPRPPDPSELFRPVRISSTNSNKRPSPAHVAELTRRFEMTSPPAATATRPPSRSSAQQKPCSRSSRSPSRERQSSDPAIHSAPPTLQRGSQQNSSSTRRGSSDSRSRKPLQTTASFISHLDGPLDPVNVTTELEQVLRRQREVHVQEQTPADGGTPQSSLPRPRLSRASPVITNPVITNPTQLKLDSSPSQQLFREQSGLLCDSIRCEHEEFWRMVERLASKHTAQRSTYMASPTISHTARPRLNRPSRQRSVYVKSPPTNVKIAMETALMHCDTAVVLQCKLTDTVADVIRKGLAMLNAHTSAHSSTSPEGYQLKVCGKDEYMDSGCALGKFECVHASLKMAVPVHVVLLERSLVKQVVTSVVVVGPRSPQLEYAVSRQELNALVDSYLSKNTEFLDKLSSAQPVDYQRYMLGVISCVRLLCERMMFVEPFDVTEAVFNLRRACKATNSPEEFASTIPIEMETIEGDWSCVSNEQLREMQLATSDDVTSALGVLHKAVMSMVELYCVTVHCDYEPVWVGAPHQPTRLSHNVSQHLRVKLLALHRVMLEEQHNCDAYQVELCVFYGGKPLSKKVFSPPAKRSNGFFPIVTWNKWINLSLPISRLPQESRICFTLLGLSLPASGLGYGGNKEVLSWVSLRLFDVKGVMCTGPQLLAMWKDDSPADPTDTCYANVTERRSMILEVMLEDLEYRIESSLPSTSKLWCLDTPPPNISAELQMMARKDRFDQLKEEELAQLWQQRAVTPSLLSMYARGLSSVIQAAPHQALSDTSCIHHLLEVWPMVDPIYGLELLDSQFADSKVREKAVEWLDRLHTDDIIDLLPQLTQSLKHDCYLSSSMTQLLLRNAMLSPRLAHHLYWNLNTLTQSTRYYWRYYQLQQALCAVCGEEMSMEWAQQVELVKTLQCVAMSVKCSKDTQRQTVMVHELQHVSSSLPPVFRLPLNPSLQCCDIDLQNCSFFNSKTVPLKLSFRNADPFGSNIDVIFKAGDDLRQDMLTLQIIRLMEKLWLKAGLDLRMVTYQCLATGPEEGMVELVPDSATLRQIQTQYGVTGSFKDKPLSEWLMRHNSSDTAWKQAIENFTHSCAGYCVATYVLGICDRHNDNIMVCKTGHMFHIDFGRILGNAQMFGSIKRDRVPFVLTPDMAYVINAGDKPSARFQKFTDLCCTAYNELRRHSHVLLSVLSLMLSGDLPELSSAEDVQYVRDALLPQASEEEATYIFTKHIEASLSSMATQINFFIHNLAQFKFSSSYSSGGLLSFSPTSYSIATDGKIESAVVVAYHKQFYPSKYIMYQVQVTRVDPTLPVTNCFRRYSEFSELHKKLTECFVDEGLPQLPGKTFLPGQSTTRETSERRQTELSWYLKDLLVTDTKISESDVVYTFLHCLLRDEQYLMKMREDQTSAEQTAGKVKLDLCYSKEHERLSVMVKHARELVPRDGADTMDPYVKLYLLPDPRKVSKQKTKVARKTLNPTYNQMFYYSVKLDKVCEHCLQLAVWDASSLLSKECLGCVLIELKTIFVQLTHGHSDWFDLQPASLIQR